MDKAGILQAANKEQARRYDDNMIATAGDYLRRLAEMEYGPPKIVVI